MTEQEAQERVKELRELLDRANKAYYEDAKPFISDREYDRYLEELEKIEQEYDLVDPASPTQRVGGEPSSEFETVEHPVSLLSLDNTYNEEELNDFDERVQKNLDGEPYTYVAELKFDGASIRLRYEQSELVLAATRGDGQQGDDITRNVKTIRDIPLQLQGEVPDVVEIRGEAYMERQAFVRLNEHRAEQGLSPFANPRNSTAGSLKMQDPREVARRPIRYFSFDLLLDETENNLTQLQKMEMLQDFGLPVCEYYSLCESIDEVHAYIDQLKKLRTDLPYETDGVVVKVNEHRLRDKLGSTSKFPRWAIAYKFQAEQATTIINEITLQIGRLGKITPVAELKPVQLAGTTVKRASLHNEDEILRKDIRPGDRVVIEKAGEIIPQVLHVINPDRDDRSQKFSMPDSCPACGEELVKLGDEVAWRCVNPQCPPQIRSRIEHFASRDAMDIDGLGEAIVDQLVTEKLISNYADLYSLKTDQLIPLERMARKSAQNLIQAIEKSKEQSLDRVIYALGIRFVGKTVARDLAYALQNMDTLIKSTEEELTQIDSIGPKIAESVVAFFKKPKNIEIIEKLQRHGLQFSMQKEEKKSNILEDKKFVLTGSLPSLTRKEATEIVEKHGGTTTSSVSSKTDYLLAGEGAGSKYDKAVELDIPIISEEDFFNMIKNEQ